ncbi:MAG: 4-hydroxy-3-methylbut-2-enyl diphosphate reductase [Acidibacillus sp.]|nr:4-hydroxy-3-methylbut-2-enyl diphosphate reductase [Acidibacillus sp.]
MENKRAIYVNTYADGSRNSEPILLTKDDVTFAARGWKRSKTLIQIHLLGIEKKVVDGLVREFLFGDIGVAKVMLPVDPEYSDLIADQDPLDLTEQWICAMVEDFDLKDEGNPYILVNRKKGLERLRELNRERVTKTDNRATGVIKGMRRGAYILDVGGYTALLPKSWYDWDDSKRNNGVIGEEFPVLTMPSRLVDRILVSRCHLTANPNTPSNLLIEKGAILRATVAYIRGAVVMADVYPGFRLIVHPTILRELPRHGDQVTVRILGRGKNQGNYYGMMLELEHQQA